MPAIAHLYVHVPFCPKVCPYCSFYKQGLGEFGKPDFGGYVGAVLTELDTRLAEGHEVRPTTVFFGGGTPSALPTPWLDRLLGGLRERIDFRDLREWTLEMNPATVSLEKAAVLLRHGVNRVSMGVQSWDAGVLATLGRVHNAEQARRSYAILREAGVPNVNLDLMFAVPGQSLDVWRDSLEQTIALGPDHIAAYNLTYEEDTEFFRRFSTGEFSQDAEEDAEFFELTQSTLGAAGYAGYEVSNFAKPGRECLHNLAYWRGADYLGLGPSAFSTVGARRWQNIPNTNEYVARVQAAQSAESFSEDVAPETRLAEQIAFGLRTSEGVPADWLAPWPEAVADLREEGLLQPAGPHRYALTPDGRLLADSVAELFV
jgi:oxygen-independent coproporphyrinogen-3 oxidase